MAAPPPPPPPPPPRAWLAVEKLQAANPDLVVQGVPDSALAQARSF